MPADAIRISVGMLLGQVGTATVDDFDLVRANPVNLLSNGSFEADSNGDGIPDCTLLTAYGQNTGTYGRTTDSHTGNWAEAFSVGSVTSGDRKVLSAFTPGCAPDGEHGAPLPGGALVQVDRSRPVARLLPQRGDRPVAVLGQVTAASRHFGLDICVAAHAARTGGRNRSVDGAVHRHRRKRHARRPDAR